MATSHRPPWAPEQKKYGLGIPYNADARPDWAWVRRWREIDLSGLNIIPLFSTHYRLDSARNELVEMALQIGADEIIFLDSDVVIPVDGIKKLIAYDEPVVSGVYFATFKGPKRPAAWTYDEEIGKHLIISPEQKPGLAPVDAIGLGFAKVRMSVFRKITPPWFYYEGGSYQDGKKIHDGAGEDFYFCKLLRKMGIPVYLATMVRCKHIKTGAVDERGNYDVLRVSDV